MKKTTFTCDHCGKELNEMHDYTEMQIDDFIDNIETDLCMECYEKLNGIILKYINKEIRL